MSRAANRFCFRTLSTAILCGSLLAACSDIYYDRRDTVSFQAGDAVAANKVTHAVDVWPEAAGYRDIQSNGQKMQSAVERYRTNKVTPPVGMDTSSIPYASREKAILRDVVTGFYLGVLRNLIGDGCDSHCYVLVVCGGPLDKAVMRQLGLSLISTAADIRNTLFRREGRRARRPHPASESSAA